MAERTITNHDASLAAGELAKWIDENHSHANELFAQAAGEVDMMDPVVHVLSRWLVQFKKAIAGKEPNADG